MTTHPQQPEFNPARATRPPRSERGHSPASARWFIELAGQRPSGGFQRNIFVDADTRPRDHTFVKQLINVGGDVYRSISQYPSPQRGPSNICPMGVFDLDDEDSPARAQADVLACVGMISRLLGIPREHIWVTFSGHKGFHLFLATKIFGEAADTATHWAWRRLADELKNTVAPSLDLAIYRDAGLIRCPNTRNRKSSLFDIPLNIAELEVMSLDEIRAKAACPRNTCPWSIPVFSPQAECWLRAQVETEQAVSIPNSSTQNQTPHLITRGWHTPPCVRLVEQETIPDGRRHQALESLARFYASVGMAGDEICERIREIDARNPIRDPDFIPRMVGYVVQNPKFRSCPSVGLSPYCTPERCPLHRLKDETSPSLTTEIGINSKPETTTSES